MSNNINKSIFVGNLTRDAELKYSASGFAISNMSIAVNGSKKVNDQWVDEASFFDLVGLGKRFEALQQYLTRGSSIAVECHAKQERWEKEGVKRSKVVFVIDNIQLIGGSNKKDNENNGGGFESDIPF